MTFDRRTRPNSDLLRLIATDRRLRGLAGAMLLALAVTFLCLLVVLWTFDHASRTFSLQATEVHGISTIVYLSPDGVFHFVGEDISVHDTLWCHIFLNRHVTYTSSFWLYPMVSQVRSSTSFYRSDRARIPDKTQNALIASFRQHIVRVRPDWSDDVVHLDKDRSQLYWVGIRWNLLRYGAAVLGAGFAVGLFFPAAVGFARRLQRLRGNVCLSCGYEYERSGTACPECGNASTAVAG